MELLKNIIEKNIYLEEQMAKLENWDVDYFHMNDIGGVDAKIYLDYKKFGYIHKHSRFKEALEEYLDNCMIGIFFDKQNDCLSISSSEEAFINYMGDELIIDGEYMPIKDDFDTWLKYEQKIIATGTYYGLYKAGYYGDCDPYKFDEDYSKFFSQDDKKRAQEIEDILEIDQFRKDLEDRTLMHWDLPQKVFDALPLCISSLDDGIEVLQVRELNPESVEIVFEFFEDDWEGIDTKAIINSLEHIQGNEYMFKHTFKNNAVRFLKSILEGNNDEMSFLSIG